MPRIAAKNARELLLGLGRNPGPAQSQQPLDQTPLKNAAKNARELSLGLERNPGPVQPTTTRPEPFVFAWTASGFTPLQRTAIHHRKLKLPERTR